MIVSSRTKLSAPAFLLALFTCFSVIAVHAQTPTRTRLQLRDRALVADVEDAVGRPVAGGVVSFVAVGGGIASGQSLGSVVVDETGRATLPLGPLPPQVSVAAVYSNAGTAPSSSPVTLISSDVAGIPDFTITANPSSLTTPQGGYATTVITVTPINNFSEAVTLSCSNLPGQAFCNFTPAIGSTAPTGTNTQAQPFTSTLQITTQSPSGAVLPPDFGLNRHGRTALAIALPGVLALAGLAGRSRRKIPATRALTVLVLFTLAAGVTLGISGCSQRYGYLKHPPSVAEGTPLGTYTINIAAFGNSGSAVTSHNLTITLAVTAQ